MRLGAPERRAAFASERLDDVQIPGGLAAQTLRGRACDCGHESKRARRGSRSAHPRVTRPLYSASIGVYNRRMPSFEVRLLGPLEVGVSGGRLELRRQKQRALLALLALRAGEVVSTDRLVEELWSGDPPKAAVGSLQNLVSELRKALGAEVLVTRSPGYVLAVERDQVDAHRFERIAREARDGPAASRVARLREALALWRGPPLADLAFESFAQAEIARLEELRASTREELFEAELELGHHGRLVAELEAFVSGHPLRERPRGQLMLALYRSGRQADALEAYRQARETLVDELGIEPSTELQRLEQAILRHDPELEVERPTRKQPSEPDRRKTVTILFADIVDSSTLAATLDPEVLRTVMRSYFDVVRTVIERHGGIVEKFIGDAAMAVFGIPEVHEDDALRAVRAATALHEAMASLDSGHDVALRICIGVNTGEVLATDPSAGESFATGSAVVLATRLQQAALPGETLLGEVTHTLVRETVASEPVEPLDLSGALGRVPAFRVLGLAEEGVGLRLGRTAPLVGRADELARLQAALAGVQSERRSRVLTILGDAGIGKSRLAAELVATTDASVLVGRCVAYGKGATYLPLAEAIRQIVPKRVAATVASLFDADDDGELVAQQIAELTGDAEGTASTGELFWAVRRFLEALAAQRPVLLVLDDVHWAEPTLLDLVEYLAAWVSDAPVLVLCLARPDLLEERPGWTEGGIRLDPLSREESAELVGELAEVTDEVRARVVDVAEGNALFVEQLLAFVVEDEAAEALDSLPPSLEALLASRIDRLEPEERSLLERAAVVGKEFTRAAVIHLSPPQELAGIDGRTATLLRKGLIRARRSTDSEDDRLRFHHALLREVAYAGITKELRAVLHERHGTWLEQRDARPEIVGFHLEQAFRFRAELRPKDPALPELAKRGGRHLSYAGIAASKRADSWAAVNLLGRATSLLPDAAPERAELLSELGIAQTYSGNSSAGEATLRNAIATASGAGDRRLELRGRIELAHAQLFGNLDSDPSELVDLATSAMPVFEAAGDDRALGRAWRHVGFVRGGLQSRHADWQAAAERAVLHYRRSGWSASGCLSDIAAALYYGPVPVADAIERCSGLLDEATDRVGRAHVLVFLGGLTALDGRPDDSRTLLHEAVETYRELGETYARANNAGRIVGHVELRAGEAPAAEQVLRDCCEVFADAHDRAALSSVASDLAQAIYEQGRLEEARSWAGTAQSHAPRNDIPAQFAWRAVTAKLLAREGALEEAERLALEAVAFADTTDSPCQRGEVLLDLAEVLRFADRPQQAAETAEQAIQLFDLKGDRPSSAKTRGFLAELTYA
jgi:DNA-binding SARP family transcriptional activator